MSQKLKQGGFVVVAIGVIIAIIGFVFFFSVFFSMTRQLEDPFLEPHFGPYMPNTYTYRRPAPFQNAVIGIILIGIGVFVAKTGLGMSLVGSSNDIASWVRGLIHGETNTVTCPNCKSAVSSSAQFCSQCGTRLP